MCDEQNDQIDEQTIIHNNSVGKIVADITVPILTTNGDNADIMVLLESVIVGVIMIVNHENNSKLTRALFDSVILETLHTSLKRRMTDVRERQAQLEETAAKDQEQQEQTKQ